MANILRGQGSSIARVLLLALLFAVSVNLAAMAQLYEQPVLAIEPGMHTASIIDLKADAAGRLAVTGSDDKTVRVCRRRTGDCYRPSACQPGRRISEKSMRWR
jgi:hypothetical protein